MSYWNGLTLLNGEYMHMTCCAHILNLIVSDGLKEFDNSVTKIRASCKYVKSSPARLATFKRCAEEENITGKAMLTLDVPTRWNSTYMMLDVAEKFEKTFMRLEFDDLSYMIALDNEGGPPTCGDWSRAHVLGVEPRIEKLVKKFGPSISKLKPHPGLILLVTANQLSMWLLSRYLLNISFFISGLYILAPIYYTLTGSISSDSILALTVSLLIVHLFLHDYSGSTIKSPGTF
ncbi:hypothetical protein Cni_G25604 [Canna indica]|uniref:AC transposase n=1 Tax=Canna indica TaxID=4628 RepID=A0AAQ3QPK1_9LILI|nr:hypothetical protein Cni_G25604 [Canna indica]